MTLAQQKLIENYNSLKSKLNSDRIDAIIAFCIYFQSDDEILYKEFESIYQDMCLGNIRTKALINLYAQRYNLDPNKDIETIRDIFLNNTIDEGFSYHLNSSANFSTIMEKGLGLSAIGIKTEERKDYEILQQSIPFEIFRMLQPYHGEKQGSKVYYSNIPILYARYGDRPEWLKELKLSSKIPDLLEQGSAEQKLVNNILEKYEKKYKEAKKVLFLIPNPWSAIIKPKLEKILPMMPPEEMISYFLDRILTQKDLYTTEHIEPNNIIAVNLESLDMIYDIDNINMQYTESSNRKR